MIIPEGLTYEKIQQSMEMLQQDVNFKVLEELAELNDISSMRRQLEEWYDETGEMSDEATKRMRYRLKVFKEVFWMPETLIGVCKTELIPIPDRGLEDDPYNSEKEVKELTSSGND